VAEDDAPEPAQRHETVRVVDLHVRYRVFQEFKPTLSAMTRAAASARRHHEVHAVRGVSFTALSGEAIGVLGPNGSGKSTLMQAIAGLLPPSEGAVYASSLPMLLGVGAVLNKKLSGRRNIMLGGLALGLTRDEVTAREAEIIEFAGIGDAIDRPMKTYSSGMQSRLQFAISSAVEPEILIIDEALAVGDADFKRKSQIRIRELRDRAGTVFVVSHSMGTIQSTCSRVLWMADGELVADGSPEEVIPQYQESQVGKKERKAKKAGKSAGAKKKRKRREQAKTRAQVARQWETLVTELAARGVDAEERERIAATVWPKHAAKRELEGGERTTSTDDAGPGDAERPLRIVR
jgi:teichoic acid transport system ATP-binding protein